VSGYALFGPGRPAALAALELARSNAMTVSVGAASAGPLATAGAEEFLGWIGSDLLLFANDAEARVLSGVEDCVEGARVLAARVGRVAVTRGAESALWCDGAGVREIPTVATDVVDSTGSGDAFSAGVIAALADGAEPAEAVGRGTELAARACRSVGARPPIGAASTAARSS
jgi:sugar/nucleoside kinase (ribokinase family)